MVKSEQLQFQTPGFGLQVPVIFRRYGEAATAILGTAVVEFDDARGASCIPVRNAEHGPAAFVGVIPGGVVFDLSQTGFRYDMHRLSKRFRSGISKRCRGRW